VSMPPAWRDCFLGHAETAQYQDAIAEAHDRTRQTAAAYRNPAVAWSGGKDCTVMLHIAMHLTSPCVAFWSDYGRPEHKGDKVFPGWMASEIEANAIAIGAESLHVSCRACDWPRADSALSDRGPAVLAHVADTTDHWVPVQQRLMQSLGHDVALVGLRRDEGVGRRHRIDAGRTLNDFPESWPVAYLSEMDVWAYIASHDLPYCSVYDKQAEITQSYLGLRVTSLFRHPSARNAGAAESLDRVLFWRDLPRG
jgi:hypothetical protein